MDGADLRSCIDGMSDKGTSSSSNRPGCSTNGSLMIRVLKFRCIKTTAYYNLIYITTHFPCSLSR